ncbi:MAG: bifunctional phosphoribosylaminoimidazolecarboxamide formyltransferase/IMP cyclohydrolase [Rhodospirillaceae bacterium]|nr:bifunctional phosphoribosylaminoimidazolecarboxamide formyltransferase/IMP cyclohydrolase [Rhodospirillaceae bacterium]
MSDPVAPIRRALISVADKTGIVEFARFLADRGVELLSTGGSAATLAQAGVPVTEVSQHTGFPEIMDGRVKTLHPKIHGGLLARRDSPEHIDAMTDYSIAPIDLLVCNLYPFEDTLMSGADWDTCVENIDIGGVAMTRAAAKNHAFVTVVVDPGDYADVMAAMTGPDNAVPLALRRRLAAGAFGRIAAYEATIAGWLAAEASDDLPKHISFGGARSIKLRYGENPHQQAALYRTADTVPGVVGARQIQGRELSYNNIADADAALDLVSEFAAPAVAIIKHANPCGVALGSGPAEAFLKARACDPVSAFGGIVALNRPLDAATAVAISEMFCEVVIAPDIAAEAQEALAAKTNLRVLITGGMPRSDRAGITVRSVAGGLLVQSRDAGKIDPGQLEVVTERPPTETEMADLLFGFAVVKHVRSNAIVFARGGMAVGIGAGQMSRIDSARIAAQKAVEIGAAEGEDTPRTAGAVVASDAFFPFADGLQAVAEAGATAVIQPGGSVRDKEVIEAANKAGMAMVFTGMRHFKH